MPHGLAWACQAHRQGQQCENRAARVIVPFTDNAVRPYTCVVINITGFRYPGNWMEQQRSFDLHRGAFRQLLMCSVERVPGLERHNVSIAKPCQLFSNLLWCQPQALEVVVALQGEDLLFARDVYLSP